MPRHRFERPRGRICELTLGSEALAENLLGDPAERTIAVYLPEDYDETDRRYPVFLHLASFTSSGLAQLGWKPFWESLPVRLDRLRHEGAMGPVILVLLDSFTSLGGNQFVDSAVLGQWASYLVRDVLPEIDRRFRTLAAARHRAVFGRSSGGYGALLQGMLHAEHWGAVACHAGDMAFDLLYLPDMPRILDALAAEPGGLAGFLERIERSPRLGGNDFHVLMGLAMAASYDPDPNAPKGIRLPVDPETCEPIPERWQRWLEHDPCVLIEHPACQHALRSLRGLWLDCGRRDEYRLHYGMRRFVRALERYGIPHHHEEFDGGHSGTEYRYDRSLPYLYAATTDETDVGPAGLEPATKGL